MINLLPPRGHTALRHEYILKVASLYGVLLGSVFVAGTALLIPSYVLTSTQLSGAVSESSQIEETKAAFDSAFGEIRVANVIMAQLRKPGDDVPFTEVVEEIVRVTPRGITFSSFSGERTENLLTEFTLQGNADTRMALSSLKNSLEASPLFAQAFVPISDLARDSNLPFVITLTLEKEATSTPTTP